MKSSIGCLALITALIASPRATFMSFRHSGLRQAACTLLNGDASSCNGRGSDIEYGRRDKSRVGVRSIELLSKLSGTAGSNEQPINNEAVNIAKESNGVIVTNNSSNEPQASVIRNARSNVLSDYIIANDLNGIDPSGKKDSTAGLADVIERMNILAAKSGTAIVVIACGVYKVSATIMLTMSNTGIVGQAPYCVHFHRTSDYGPTIRVANASSAIFNITLKNLWSIDLSTSSGSMGFMSCASSPFHYVIDGVRSLKFDDMGATGGCGGTALYSVQLAYLNRTEFETQQIPGHVAESGRGEGIYIGVSSNTNIRWPYGSVIIVNEPEIEGGASYGTIKLFDGIRLDGVDGFWLNDGHVQSTTNADLHVANFDNKPMYNIHWRDTMLDIGSGSGLKLDGTSQVQRASFRGPISASGAYPSTASNGVLVTGTGGITNGIFDLSVDGYGANGFYFDALNSSNISIRPRTFTNNGLKAPSSYSDVAIISPTDVTISGGNLNSPNMQNEIHIGPTASIITVNGVNMAGNIGHPMTIDFGATNYTVTGNTCHGNSAGGIVDNGGFVTKTIASNTGC